MTFYQRLERKFGKYAIPDLMKYICVIYVVGYIIMMFNPYYYDYWLALDPDKILHGQIWRIITFLFFPPSFQPIWMVIAVFVYYSLGTTLERMWGTVKYNFFYFSGVLLLVVASLLFYIVTGVSMRLYPTYMTFSIFLAYALTFPDSVFYLYFFIPIKAQWLAIAEVVLYLYMFISAPFLSSTQVEIAVSLLNVALFFFLTNQKQKKSNVFHINDFR
ncbi:hypothetical protein SAMN05216349_101267 [Oribacterium sp. KHPX15]|uniref:rhomboid family intramembrane serine protease n=1 Tax=unclassified Oribacterium TaxID=2629782 RepID=UPI0004E19B2E|nr:MULTISPECIES: rhomboid family intramembrane serine protease [unclassified Oribacterium]SDZ83308.1 hypothetical protein SAMN05216349_101267 [Oribacterium sp. KHPX15]